MDACLVKSGMDCNSAEGDLYQDVYAVSISETEHEELLWSDRGFERVRAEPILSTPGLPRGVDQNARDGCRLRLVELLGIELDDKAGGYIASVRAVYIPLSPPADDASPTASPSRRARGSCAPATARGDDGEAATLMARGDERVNALRDRYGLDLLRAAIHEAGHQTVYRLYGFPVLAVTIDSQGEVMGCIWPAFWANGGVENILASMTCTAGGPAAEKQLNVAPGDESDLQSMKRQARALLGEVALPESIQDEITQSQQRAERLVRDNWDHVVDIAEGLLRHHAIVKRIRPEHRDKVADEAHLMRRQLPTTTKKVTEK